MINVAILGVGNCASSLVQGKFFYQNNPRSAGLLNELLGKYSVNDIEFVAAFDIDKRKVGQDISTAIFSCPNNALVFAEVPFLNVSVLKGHLYDGIANHMNEIFIDDTESDSVDIVAELIKSKADVLINYLPVGSKAASLFYAEQALKAGVAFINAIPEFICSNEEWAEKFRAAGIPCAGDDIKSQIGATIIHRTLAQLIYQRGCTIKTMYQLNIGGNSDFRNMTDEGRLQSKRVSKTSSVLSAIPANTEGVPLVKIGPSEYVPHLHDKKICYINVSGLQFGHLPFEIELKLTVEDSPNSAGVMIDVVRLIKIAKDNNIGGNVLEINAFGFKTPAVQVPDNIVYDLVSKFVLEFGG